MKAWISALASVGIALALPLNAAMAATVSVLNIATLDSGSTVDVRIDGSTTELAYKGHMRLKLRSGESASILLAEQTLLEVEESELLDGDLIVIHGDRERYPLRAEVFAVDDRPTRVIHHAACDTAVSRCLDVYDFAPLAGNDRLQVDLSCEIGNRGTRRIMGTFYGAAISSTFDKDESAVCSLNNVSQRQNGVHWPEVRNIKVPANQRFFVFLIGDGERNPTEVVAVSGVSLAQLQLGHQDPWLVMPKHKASWYSEDQTGAGMVLDFMPDGEMTASLFAVQYFYDQDGVGRWYSLMLTPDASDPARYIGQRYESDRVDGQLHVAPIDDAILEIADDQLTLMLFGAGGDQLMRYFPSVPGQ